MKTFKIMLAAALIGTSGLALADYSGTRAARMQSALDNYRSGRGTQASGQALGERDATTTTGPVARNGNSVKQGAQNAGQAIKRGARKAGHAIGTGLNKTGAAIGNAGNKLKSKTTTTEK